MCLLFWPCGAGFFRTLTEQARVFLTEKTPIAHRGLHDLADGAPENSLAAFAAALQAGYPIELDVRLLADGSVVVFHDAEMARLTGAEGPIEAQTAATLRDWDILKTGEPIPLLAEVLRHVVGRVPLLIELKHSHRNAPGALEAATLAAMDGYAGAFALQSFHVATVAWFARHAPQIARGQLAVNDDWTLDLDHDPAPHFLAYHLAALPTPFTTAWCSEGRPLLAWTVQTTQQQARAEEAADNYIFEFVRPEKGATP